jgi:hypothetical protein
MELLCEIVDLRERRRCGVDGYLLYGSNKAQEKGIVVGGLFEGVVPARRTFRCREISLSTLRPSPTHGLHAVVLMTSKGTLLRRTIVGNCRSC